MGRSASQTTQQAASSSETFHEDSAQENLQADGSRSQNCVPAFKTSRSTPGQRVEQAQNSANFLPVGQRGSSSQQDLPRASDNTKTGILNPMGPPAPLTNSVKTNAALNSAKETRGRSLTKTQNTPTRTLSISSHNSLELRLGPDGKGHAKLEWGPSSPLTQGSSFSAFDDQDGSDRGKSPESHRRSWTGGSVISQISHNSQF